MDVDGDVMVDDTGTGRGQVGSPTTNGQDMTDMEKGQQDKGIRRGVRGR